MDKIDLRPYMDDIENRIDPDFETELIAKWKEYSDGKNTDSPFEPPRRTPKKSKLNWQHMHINDALLDETRMAYSQLEFMNAYLSTASKAPLNVRPNYGCSVIPYFFGAEMYVMPRDMECLPNARRAFTRDEIDKILEVPLPSFDCGIGPQIAAVEDVFAKMRRDYPKMGQFVYSDSPDLQGPMDNLEIMWGSDVFYAVYDEPEAVHALLNKITDFYIAYYEHWMKLAPNKEGYFVYRDRMCKGQVFLRDDSAMNLSPDFYMEFVYPYDARILKHFGGGGIHFCGRGHHFVPLMAKTPHLTQINMSQPEMNDMSKIFTATLDMGLNLTTTSGLMPKEPMQGKHDFSRLCFLNI